MRGNILGDTNGTPTQVRVDTIANVANLTEYDTDIIGSLLSRTLSPTAYTFRGRGTGAPAFAATKGSMYLRTDGGANTTLYINEAGTTTWVAK
jgi:hypothetical protein